MSFAPQFPGKLPQWPGGCQGFCTIARGSTNVCPNVAAPGHRKRFAVSLLLLLLLREGL